MPFSSGRAPDPSQATEPHPHDGGFRTAAKPNLDCDGDGVQDCFGDGSFNVPPLIEAADTEPFFHNHSAANSAFNSAISIQRNSAALTLETSRDKSTRETVNMLLALSNSEAADAIEVLSHRQLHPKAVRLLRRAISKNGRAMAAKPANTRLALIRGALNDLKAAKAQFGTGLDFVLGEGNLLF